MRIFALLFILSVISLQAVKAQNFVHPGLPFTINDLERMKANRASVEPWKESWAKIMSSNQAKLDYTMQGPAVDVQNKGNDNIYISDITAMLYHALQWYFTGNEAHAELAISLIEPWAETHKTWSGTSAHLGAAWRGGTMAQACEIMRYTYPGWTDELTALTEDYFENVFWHLFRLPNPLRAANQGANNLMGATYVAIYCNDQEKFDMCIDAFLNDACGGISNTLPNGENGDTGRDQGHAMGMIGNLATVCELAWAQGVDLYAALDNRLLAVHEYWCNYNLGNEVEYIGFGTCYNYFPTIGPDGRNAGSSDAIPVTELVYGAYAVRKGLPAPFVTEYREGMGVDENTFIFAKDTTFMTTAPFNHAPDPVLTTSKVTSLTGVNIGSVSAAGTEVYNDDIWTVEGAGSNVYGGGSDAFHFSYVQMNGDASLIAKVNSLENTSSSAKAAVVIRESLDANSKMATLSLSSSEAAYNSRGFVAADGRGSLSDGDTPIPFWIKIERHGANIAGFVSPDGENWAAMQYTLFDMSDDYYIGLGVSSGSSSNLCTTVFSDVKIGVVEEGTENLGAYSLIEAEAFSAMSGIETATTSDDSGMSDLTSINSGDWVEYEIYVPFSGTYSMDYRVASASESGDLTIAVLDETIEQITFSATGGADEWRTVQSSTPFYLNQGLQTIKLTANSDAWKINWLRLLVECKASTIIPYVEALDPLGELVGKYKDTHLTIFPGNTAILSPKAAADGVWSWTGPNGFSSSESKLTFDAITGDKTGEYMLTYTNDCGLVDKDTFSITVTDSVYFEAENYSAMEGVSVEATSDISGESNVSNIVSGNWMDYEIDVPFSALYDINYRIASEANGSFTASVNGAEVAQVSFDATGGSQNWATINSGSLVFLQAGIQTLRITSNSDNWKLNWVEVTGKQIVQPCALPYVEDRIRIRDASLDWTSGVMDITCGAELDLHALIDDWGKLNETDYLNIYYRLDGGEKVTLVEVTGNVDPQMVSATKFKGSTIEIIVQSEVSSSGYYDVDNLFILKSSNPFDRIEAETYNDSDGGGPESTGDVGGGLNVGSLKDGNYLMYSNLNLTGAKSISLRLASRNSGGTVEVRLNSAVGSKIAEFDMPNTGSWQNWKTVSADIKDRVGIYDVYIVFKHPSTYVGNINWFEFSEEAIGGTSIEAVGKIQEIILYPNPVTNNLTIEGRVDSKIEIVSALGQKVIEDVLQSSKHTISMQGLETGMYIVRVQYKDTTKAYKLIKQ